MNLDGETDDHDKETDPESIANTANSSVAAALGANANRGASLMNLNENIARIVATGQSTEGVYLQNQWTSVPDAARHAVGVANPL